MKQNLSEILQDMDYERNAKLKLKIAKTTNECNAHMDPIFELLELNQSKFYYKMIND